MMTEDEFRREYGALYHDEEFHYQRAILFAKSGWTAQKLNAVVHLDAAYANSILRFGRFLSYAPVTDATANLTSKTFKKRMLATDQSLPEEERFRDVCIALGVEPPTLTQTKAMSKKAKQPTGSESRARRIREYGVEEVVTAVDTSQITANKGAEIVGGSNGNSRELQLQLLEAALTEPPRTSPSRHDKRLIREARIAQRAKLKAATRTAMEKSAARPEITPQQAKRPPPELANQEVPGTGASYAFAYTARYGHISHDQDKRRELLMKKLEHHLNAIEREVTGPQAVALEPEDFAALLDALRASHRAFFSTWRKAKQWIPISLMNAQRNA